MTQKSRQETTIRQNIGAVYRVGNRQLYLKGAHTVFANLAAEHARNGFDERI